MGTVKTSRSWRPRGIDKNAATGTANCIASRHATLKDDVARQLWRYDKNDTFNMVRDLH